MPYVFKYQNLDNTEESFECVLHTERCVGHLQNNPLLPRCKRMVTIATPYCWQHLESLKHLQIKSSKIPNGGIGLYAYVKGAGVDTIVFKKGQTIIDYYGERIDQSEADNRYGKNTAPYAVKLKHNDIIDAAIVRGVASSANRPLLPLHKSNASFTVNYRATPQQVIVKATVPIRNGDEILIPYGNTYKLHESNIRHSTSLMKKK